MNLKSSIGESTKTMIKNVYNSATCYISAYNQSVYASQFNTPGSDWIWSEIPTIDLSIYDVTDDAEFAFNQQYFNLTLK